MRTSQQWWEDTKKDPELLAEWLRKQFHGERTATIRIVEMSTNTTNAEFFKTLRKIAAQESKHAFWVKGLLTARGIEPREHNENERYWKQVQPSMLDFEHKAAVATLAEGMRLERIRVIAADEDAPPDIREVFAKILVDEVWHEQAFAQMTTQTAVEAVKPFHGLGREVLGLEP